VFLSSTAQMLFSQCLGGILYADRRTILKIKTKNTKSSATCYQF
jgi:hypothetical protein